MFTDMIVSSVLAVFSLRFVFFKEYACFPLRVKKNSNINCFLLIHDGLCLSDGDSPEVCFYSSWVLEVNDLK